MVKKAGGAKLILLAGAILLAILVPFFLWGARFDEALSLEGSREWLLARGRWAWAAGIGLLVGDIVLPIPSTVVMSAIGLIYGWLLGGLVSAAGSMLSGIAAHAACQLKSMQKNTPQRWANFF